MKKKAMTNKAMAKNENKKPPKKDSDEKLIKEYVSKKR